MRTGNPFGFFKYGRLSKGGSLLPSFLALLLGLGLGLGLELGRVSSSPSLERFLEEEEESDSLLFL